MGTGNYSAASNIMKLVHWPLMGDLLHLVHRGGAWAGCGPVQSPPRCTKCYSPPSVPITVLLYNGRLVRGFTVPINWKRGIILPFYKWKGQRTDCQNYRSITLLSVPGKVYAHVLLNRIQATFNNFVVLNRVDLLPTDQLLIASPLST